MLSEIFILSMSGEVVIWKKYCHDLPKDSPEVFFRKVKECKSSSLPPMHVESGVHYFHIKRQILLFVAATKQEMLPIYVIELLSRIYSLCKDFCGVVNEESLKSNFILVYELLDEVMDYGVVQIASTEKLKPYIQSEPVAVRMKEMLPENVSPGLFGIEHRTAPNTAANKPVIRSRWEQEMRRNEIFLDVIERMSVLIAANGVTIRTEVNGQVNMKSFLVGCPYIKMGLNEDLTIGKDDLQKGYGNIVHLDEVAFHESVKMEEFSSAKILKIYPPEGEFAVMKYQLHGDLPQGLPFRVMSYIRNSDSSRDVEIGVKLRCDIPSNCHAINLTVSIPVSKATSSISQQLNGPGQSAELIHAEKRILWKIKKIYGKTDATAHFKLITQNNLPVNKMELGPIALNFELSGFVSSNLQIRFLRVFEKEHSYVPLRWVRYVTVTDSYILKVQ